RERAGPVQGCSDRGGPHGPVLSRSRTLAARPRGDVHDPTSSRAAPRRARAASTANLVAGRGVPARRDRLGQDGAYTPPPSAAARSSFPPELSELDTPPVEVPRPDPSPGAAPLGAV